MGVVLSCYGCGHLLYCSKKTNAILDLILINHVLIVNHVLIIDRDEVRKESILGILN